MAPSVEGPPIISARALRWSDEEVSLVCLFCLLHFISSGRRRRRSCCCLFVFLCDVPADGGRRWTNHIYVFHGPTIRPSKALHAIISLVSSIQFQCCSHLPSLPSHRFAIVSRAIQFQHVPLPFSRVPCSVFVLNPQVSFNSPSIYKNRCGQGYGLALGSWFLYQRHFREATNIRISRSRPFEQNPSNGLGCSVCLRVDVANVSSISRDRSVPQALPFSLAVLRRSSCSVAEGGCVLIIITVGLPFGRRLVSPTSFHSFLCVRDCWSTHEKT